MNETLRPCPYCNGPAKLVDDQHVACDVCGARGPSAKLDRVFAWNDVARRLADVSHLEQSFRDVRAINAQMLEALRVAGFDRPTDDPAGFIRELAARSKPQGDAKLGGK